MIHANMIEHLRSIIPPESTILELGSGHGSVKLAETFKVYSIEHSRKWYGLFPEINYIWAPLVPYKDTYFHKATHWYDHKILETALPDSYEAIIVDGPPGTVGRGGFYTYLDLFKTDVPIFFDDVRRLWEFRLMGMVAGKLNKNPTVYNCQTSKWYGVIS
jgi:hypothetical protein